MEADLSDPNVLSDAKRYRATLRDHAFLKKLESAYSAYEKVAGDIRGNEELLADPDFKDEAAAELEVLKGELEKAERHVLAALLPPDPFESRPAVMEIRAGTGGEEAALFAGDLFRMYSRYAERQGWRVEILSANATEIGGFKEITFLINGHGAYSRLKYESGAHRVQRVPVTESGGRIHTSAATVAVLPEAEEVDVAIDPKDLRIDTYCASGAGGQYVNRTETAIRITHLPTGIVVQCQDEKSQLKNKEKAMKVLRARLKDKAQREQENATNSDRRSQVGSGDRSERIRTYNFPQGRVTDHRIGLTVHRIDAVLGGDLDEILAALITADQAQRLKQVD